MVTLREKMDWKAYRDDVAARKEEAETQIAWMKEHNVTTRQRRGSDTDWTDITSTTIYEQERIIDTYEKLIRLIDETHLKNDRSLNTRAPSELKIWPRGSRCP